MLLLILVAVRLVAPREVSLDVLCLRVLHHVEKGFRLELLFGLGSLDSAFVDLCN